MDRAKLAIGLTVGVGCAVAFLAVHRGVLWLPPCKFHEITGLYCPGCGSTRAVLRLMHGDLAGALRANVMLFVLGPFTLYLLASQIRSILPGGTRKQADVPNWVAFAVVGVLVVYWVARNIPLYPFSLLAPE